MVIGAQSLSSEKSGYRAALCPRSDELEAGDRRMNQRRDSGHRMRVIKYPCALYTLEGFSFSRQLRKCAIWG
jgi:hypothetical protein